MENAEQEIGAESPPKPVDRRKSGPVFNWQQDGWPKFAFDRAALRDELLKSGAVVVEGTGPQTRYSLNFEFGKVVEPVNDPINDPINLAISNAVKKFPASTASGWRSRSGAASRR